MTLAELKHEAQALSVEERAALAAYLLELNFDEDLEFGQRMSRILNDKDPAKWLTLEEVEKGLQAAP